MARSPRLFAPGLYYHVYTRGNNRESIFFSHADYIRFLQNLERFRESLKYKVCAYCLLSNHFHILLQVGEVSLSKIMQVLMTAYTMYVNKKYNRVGHVFQGRFKSIVVQEESYFLQVLRYIHLNPLKAQLTDKLETYLWSSYPSYLFETDRFVTIARSEVLAYFSQDTLKQKKLFTDFTSGGIHDEFDPEKAQVRGVLGNDLFRQKLTRVFGGVRP